MVEQLRVLADLLEDLSSVLSSHVVGLLETVTPTPEDPVASSDLHRHQRYHIHGIYTQTHNIYVKRKTRHVLSFRKITPFKKQALL